MTEPRSPSDTPPLSDELAGRLARLEAAATPFLRAGGRVTLAEFLRLPAEEQAALARAGDRHVERALATLALYVARPDRALEALDGGSARRRWALATACREVALERRGGAP